MENKASLNRKFRELPLGNLADFVKGFRLPFRMGIEEVRGWDYRMRDIEDLSIPEIAPNKTTQRVSGTKLMVLGVYCGIVPATQAVLGLASYYLVRRACEMSRE